MSERAQQQQTVRIPFLSIVPTPPAPPVRRELGVLRAVLFLPAGVSSAAQWTNACGAYIQRRGYRLAAVCAAWRDAVRLITTGAADVIVVGRRDHLDPDRTPRLDIVTEQGDPKPADRRPRRRR
jgi:hypothetical protein